MLKSMRLSARIAGGFSLPLTVTVLVGLGTLFLCSRVKEQASVARDESLAFVETAWQMKLDVVQVQQWLSDISATRGLDGLDDGFKKAEDSRNSFKADVEKFREMFRRKGDQQSLGKIDALEAAFQEYYEAGTLMAKAYVEKGPEAGNRFMASFDQAAENLNELVTPFLNLQTVELHAAMDNTVGSAERIQVAVSAAGLFILLSTLFIGWMITRSISGTLQAVAEGLEAGAGQVAAASRQLASSSQELAAGASEQAAAIEETSSALEEVSSMVRQNADNSLQANHSMQRMSQAFEEARASMTELSRSMSEISVASEETQKIIKTIDEIAFQTNLLALNAAVEAARAGEAGAGFAVVAEEVRNLARRAAEAARNTAYLIEGTLKKVHSGAEIAESAGGAFERVMAEAGINGALVDEITAASREQAQGIEQVAKAVGEMDKVVQRNAANAEEAASASEELNAQAEHMKSYVQELVVLVRGMKRTRTSAAPPVDPASREIHIHSARERRGKTTSAPGGRQFRSENGKGHGRQSSARLLTPTVVEDPNSIF